MKSEISFIEIGVADAGQTRHFLWKLFDWEFHPLGTEPEGWFQTPSIKAGLHGKDTSQDNFVFFGVPDLQVAMAKVKDLGGQMGEATDEPGFGRFCTCLDPQGLKFGIHQR